MELFVACSSSDKISNRYLEACREYLSELFDNDNNLVFGASSKGLMGLSYRLSKEKGKNVTGICPVAYKDDLRDLDCENTILTKSISERTDELIAKSDAIIFLPGGIGTIYEFFASLESKRCGEFDKPMIIYNACGYFDKMFEFLDVLYQEEFSSSKIKNCYYFSNSADDTLNYIKNYKKDQEYNN